MENAVSLSTQKIANNLYIPLWIENIEDALRQSENNLRAIFNSLQDAFIMVSPDMRVLTYNIVASEMALRCGGKPLIQGEPITNSYCFKGNISFMDCLEQALGGEVIRVEDHHRIPDGSEGWFHYTFNSVLAEDSQVLGVCMIVSDITERKQTEAALAKSKELFKVLLEGLKDYAFFLLDLDGTVREWSGGAENLLGYSEKEILGRNFSVLFAGCGKSESYPQYLLAMADKQHGFEQESLIVCKDGRKFLTHFVINPLVDSKGEVYGYANITRNISQRRSLGGHRSSRQPSTLDEM